MNSLQDRRLIKPHNISTTKRIIIQKQSFTCCRFVTQRYWIEDDRVKMARFTAVFFGLMLILSCETICSSALTSFSLEGKLQELEVRLEAKIEAKNAQLEEKVTQLEAQLELNVSLLLLF
jgi:hypothetical protein